LAADLYAKLLKTHEELRNQKEAGDLQESETKAKKDKLPYK
jgi:hypothetical protein